MGWFVRTVTTPVAQSNAGPDTVSALCQLLKKHPAEWESDEIEEDGDSNDVFSGLRHVSGVRLQWRFDPEDGDEVWIAPCGDQWVPFSFHDGQLILAAIRASAVARASGDGLPIAEPAETQAAV